jgi:hypothetical protein
MNRLWKIIKGLLLAIVAVVLICVLPIGYVELLCKSDGRPLPYQPLITDPAYQRKEANSYLTYPEWHIVYAYEGLAEVLKSGDEHAFSYTSSIIGFWTSACSLNKVADEHGGADWPTRQTNYVIGASFTLEMLMKALYEEGIGRFTAFWRGSEKSPQDILAREMAADYAAFLYQTPWYKYDFMAARAKLFEAPVTSFMRGHERRIGLGVEWWAKSKYAAMINNAVAATGLAKLEIRSVVSKISESELRQIPDVIVVATLPQGVLIETPRYARFTAIMGEIFERGGTMVEIAGNDDVMVTATGTPAGEPPSGSQILTIIPRDGFGDQRVLLSTKVEKLSRLFAALKSGPLRLEHVYDY